VSEPRIPSAKHFSKPVPQHGKALKLFIEILQLDCSKRSDFFAGRPALLSDLQESRQLIQREPDGKGMLHEPNPIYRLWRVFAIAIGGAPGPEKAFPLIVAESIGAKAAKAGELRRPQISADTIFPHKYGI
jgi:hypothetical protein